MKLFDGPFHRIFHWKEWVLFLFVILGICSALAIVYSKHETRRLHATLQSLYAHRDELQMTWGKLVLEQAAWSSDLRVERVAKKELGMIMPGKITLVTP